MLSEDGLLYSNPLRVVTIHNADTAHIIVVTFLSSRKDFQIKHMGHRIELGEIETYMNAIEGLLRSCCIFDTDENKILGFFEIEGASELDRKGVTHALKDKVPQWMIPNVLVKVETMPITKNGKIDRKELMKIYKEQEA